MCKIRHLFGAKRSIENLQGMIGRLFYQKFYFQYLAYDVIMKYSKKKKKMIKQITQKSDFNAKRSTS